MELHDSNILGSGAAMAARLTAQTQPLQSSAIVQMSSVTLLNPRIGKLRSPIQIGATPVGPLSSFSGPIPGLPPYRDGVALIGDAAAASDPTYGQGLQLTLRDVRVLRDHLISNDDWDAAAHAYARDHDWHYGVIHKVDNWWTQLLLTHGSEPDARRDRAISLMAEDPTRIPDHVMCGPDLPADETVRRRFFGEE